MRSFFWFFLRRGVATTQLPYIGLFVILTLILAGCGGGGRSRGVEAAPSGELNLPKDAIVYSGGGGIGKEFRMLDLLTGIDKGLDLSGIEELDRLQQIVKTSNGYYFSFVEGGSNWSIRRGNRISRNSSEEVLSGNGPVPFFGLTGVGGWLVWTQKSADPDSKVDVKIMELATGESRTYQQETRNVVDLRTSPNSEGFAYTVSTGTGNQLMYVRDPFKEPRRIDAGIVPRNLAFSLDGVFIYYLKGNSNAAEVHRVNTVTNEVYRVTASGGAKRSFVVSPNGTEIAFSMAVSGGYLEIYRRFIAPGAEELRLLRDRRTTFDLLQWTPDVITVNSLIQSDLVLERSRNVE